MPTDVPPGLFIFGCGSQAVYVVDCLLARQMALPVAIVDLETGGMVGSAVGPATVTHNLDAALTAFDPRRHRAVVAHGDNRRKLEIVSCLAAAGAAFESALHPAAVISPLAQVAAGCIVNAGAVILPNVRLEPHVIIHSMTSIDHDCQIGEGANIAPGVAMAGRVSVGRGAWIYTGAAVTPKRRIGAFAVVGAGAVVIRDVADGETVAGNPARTLRRRGGT
jgi:sugar O-acyltransferase (sialic acid O-acetyltransferase NeuD family)